MATKQVPKRINKFKTYSVIEPDLSDFLNSMDVRGEKLIACVHKGLENYNHEFLVISLFTETTWEEVPVIEEAEALVEA